MTVCFMTDCNMILHTYSARVRFGYAVARFPSEKRFSPFDAALPELTVIYLELPFVFICNFLRTVTPYKLRRFRDSQCLLEKQINCSSKSEGWARAWSFDLKKIRHPLWKFSNCWKVIMRLKINFILKAAVMHTQGRSWRFGHSQSGTELVDHRSYAKKNA